VVAAEGGLWLGVLLLIVGPLWGRVAWGTWWTWEPRLTLTLLLWFIYLGYFLVRGAASNPERGKRLAAVVAIVGVLDIPLIHMSVYWFRSLHPEPVVLRPEGPTADAEIVTTLLASLGAWTVLFIGLFIVRYGVEIAERNLLRSRPQEIMA
jgi:heme exporter protein C